MEYKDSKEKLTVQQDRCVNDSINIRERTLTPCEKLGLTEGSFAVYTNATKSNYTINPVIKILNDDRSDMPRFSCTFSSSGHASFIKDVDWLWIHIDDISNYFSDNKNPSENELILLALELDVSVESLKEQIRLLSGTNERG